MDGQRAQEAVGRHVANVAPGEHRQHGQVARQAEREYQRQAYVCQHKLEPICHLEFVRQTVRHKTINQNKEMCFFFKDRTRATACLFTIFKYVIFS